MVGAPRLCRAVSWLRYLGRSRGRATLGRSSGRRTRSARIGDARRMRRSRRTRTIRVQLHRHLERGEGLDPDRLRHRRHAVGLQRALAGETHEVLGERQAERIGRVVADEEVRVAEDRPADQRSALAQHDLGRREVEVALDGHAAGRRAGEDAAGRLVRGDRRWRRSPTLYSWTSSAVMTSSEPSSSVTGRLAIGSTLLKAWYTGRTAIELSIAVISAIMSVAVGKVWVPSRVPTVPAVQASGASCGQPRGHGLDRALGRVDAHDA